MSCGPAASRWSCARDRWARTSWSRRSTDVQLLGIRSNTTVTERVLEATPDLEAIGCFCIGTNQVDLAAAAERGIGGVQRAVLQHPQRRRAGDRRDHRAGPPAAGEDPADARRHLGQVGARAATRSAAARSGIVGYGNIGTQLSNVAEALGHAGGLLRHRGPSGPRQRPPDRRRSSELLDEADVVSLHVDGRPGNAGLFGADAVRADEAASAVHQRLPRDGRRRRRAARATSCPGTSRARRSTCSPSSRRPRATRSSRRCAASTTSS